MAAATGLLQLDTKPGARAAIVCSTMREVTKPLITKKITDYRPSVPGPTYLEHCFFNYLHNVFYAVANTIQMLYSTFS